jgi:hypothetical protein
VLPSVIARRFVVNVRQVFSNIGQLPSRSTTGSFWQRLSFGRRK